MAEVEVETKPSIDISKSKMEIVERKGIGHPDSLADSYAALLSMLYSNYCIKKFGRILHHNVDKVAMAGGSSDATFGDGRITEPVQVLFVGRGINTVGKDKIPIPEMAHSCVENIIRKNIGPKLTFTTDARWIKPGSIDLVTNFDNDGVPRANDTSFATSWAPLSKTEETVLFVEKFLNGDYKRSHPYIGSDIKVMGRRIGDRYVINLAIAFIASEIKDIREYINIKEEVRSAVSERFGLDRNSIMINTADQEDKGVVYLTVSGSSAECGDDGQVGRGNRITGIIAPARPNTLEAIAGKNPNRHVGNFYNVWASMIAKKVWKELNVKNDVQIVSTVGRPITECDIFVRTEKDSDESKVKNIARDVVNSYGDITNSIINGRVDMYPYDMVNGLIGAVSKGFI